MPLTMALIEQISSVGHVTYIPEKSSDKSLVLLQKGTCGPPYFKIAVLPFFTVLLIIRRNCTEPLVAILTFILLYKELQKHKTLIWTGTEYESSFKSNGHNNYVADDMTCSFERVTRERGLN